MSDTFFVGTIGANNHADRIIKIIEANKIFSVKNIYTLNNNSNIANRTQNLSDLYDNKAIFILSPDNTHYYYLEKLLREYRGYIFCEKPPVNTDKELDNLTHIIDSKRVFFNFNLRHSILNEKIMDVIRDGGLGRLLHVDAITSHGLAFQRNYIHSWRSENNNSPHRIALTKSIHYFDLLLNLFGKPDWVDLNAANLSGHEKSIDTCTIFMRYSEGATASICASYAAPYNDRITIYGTNGQIEYNGDDINFSGPRDTFDSQGRFSRPPSKQLHKFNENLWDESLKKSINIFLNHVQFGKFFPVKWWKDSFYTNKKLLEIISNYPK